uniref:Integrase catalytic domain-containing protein n=1 Tax=Vitis vinifera TaxID=29760 RepID=A5BLI2_VITVI|nr:hypothetical protein VITISV_008931 [Vitis vinifera]
MRKKNSRKTKPSPGLHSGLADHIFTKIMNLETPKQVWDKLQGEFEGSERVKTVRLLTLKREFELMKMKDDESIKDYSGRLMDVVNQIRLLGEAFTNQKVVENIMVSVPQNFEAKIFAIEESCDLQTLTIVELTSKFHAQEQKVLMRGDKTTEGAFQANHKGKNSGNLQGKKFFKNNKGKVEGSSRKGKFSPCSHCRRTNHAEKDCWYKVQPKVKLGNGEVVQAKGKGTIAISTKRGTKIVTNALYIPDLDQNLLSVAQMLRNGYVVSFKENFCFITDVHGTKIAKIKMNGNSFYLKLDLVESHVFSAKIDESVVWHKRYGHFKLKSLRFMQEAGMVEDMPKITVNAQTCESSPYSPQQNGVSERNNRTVMEMARCMLFEKKLPKLLWAEVVNTSVYLLNRLPTKSFQSKTPIEAWFGVKPSVKHLKVFGSFCYLHVPSVKRGKLDERAKKGVFVGYAAESKGYRIYSLSRMKIVISREVHFDENSYWNWDLKKVHKCDQTTPSILEPAIESTIIEGPLDVEATSDTPVLKMRPLSDVYERCNLVHAEPTCYTEAARFLEWIEAMKVEIDAIERNGTWKHKARLVVKGFAQVAGVDYGDTFAPVARHDTIRLLLALAGQMGWKVYHLDVKSAFLNGILLEEIYVQQPEGFEVIGHEHKVYKLHKALYGLKQAPRAWYSIIDSHLIQLGFRRSENEVTLYLKQNDDGLQLVVSLNVDDMLVTGSNRKYAMDILKKFKLESCKEVATPLAQNEKISKNDGEKLEEPFAYRSLVGSLLYLTVTKPDLMFLASLLSRFMSSPSNAHMGVAKRVLKYVKGTKNLGIWYLKTGGVKLDGYADSDWAGSVDDMKSTSGYVFTIGSGVICWNSRKQEVVAQSTTEVEYISLAAAANQEQSSPTELYCDNKSAISIAQNPIQHGRTKHINVKFHSIREAEKNSLVKLHYCSTDVQLADIMTKGLPKSRLEFLRLKLGMSKANLKEEC